jgi:hypothetical protein
MTFLVRLKRPFELVFVLWLCGGKEISDVLPKEIFFYNQRNIEINFQEGMARDLTNEFVKIVKSLGSHLERNKKTPNSAWKTSLMLLEEIEQKLVAAKSHINSFKTHGKE